MLNPSQVTGRDVGSFGVDKQTLLLATIRERNLNVNAPIISINITDIQPQPQPRTVAGRRYLLQDSLPASLLYVTKAIILRTTGEHTA